MSRVPQARGVKGSQRWIQDAVTDDWPDLNGPILDKLPSAKAVRWLSPRMKDEFSEYRDGAFLKLLRHPELRDGLREFWPNGGPQWDALGRTDSGDLLLVEAKAHVAEICSPRTGASAASRERIASRLEEVAERLGPRSSRVAWTDYFYQLGNRIAHLDFLRAQGAPAYLVLVNFLKDTDMNGPSTSEAWEAAYQVAFHVMGLPQRHALSPFIIDIYPDVTAHRNASG